MWLWRLSMNRGAVAIFVKTPGLSPVKTRLAVSLGRQKTEAHYRHFVSETQTLVSRFLQEHGHWVAYWAVAEKEGLRDPLWNRFSTLELSDRSFGERLGETYNSLVDRYGSALIMGSDTPHLPQRWMSQAVEALASSPYVLGPTEDGGFYLFAGTSKVDMKVWRQTSWSSSHTTEQFMSALYPQKVQTLPMTFDIDRVEDLTRYQNLKDGRELEFQKPGPPDSSEELVSRL